MLLHTKRLKLYATAIALQQMHGERFAQAFLEEQRIAPKDAVAFTTWATMHCHSQPTPTFEKAFQQAIQLLETTSSITTLSASP